jgi:hypothetical protein
MELIWFCCSAGARMNGDLPAGFVDERFDVPNPFGWAQRGAFTVVPHGTRKSALPHSIWRRPSRRTAFSSRSPRYFVFRG